MQRELRTLEARDRELGKLFSRIHQDNIAQKINDDCFGRDRYAFEIGGKADKFVNVGLYNNDKQSIYEKVGRQYLVARFFGISCRHL